jgi:hypothetical protein
MLAALLAIGFTASAARAQCQFEHPKKARVIESDLVQAFVSCGTVGGNPVNNTTEGGVPSCSPPETFNEQDGSPCNGWLWDETKSRGNLRFSSTQAPVAVRKDTTLPIAQPIGGPLSPPGSKDLFVHMQLHNIIDCTGAASGTGTLATVARATLDDRGADGMAGTLDDTDMTIVDFPAGFPFTLTEGRTNLKTSADALLNSIGQVSLPSCTSIEVVSVSVLDENGNAFASMGTFLTQ